MKTCNVCGEEKTLDCFSWKSKSAGTKQHLCKDCRKQKDSEKYRSDRIRREAIRESTRNQKIRNKKFIIEYFKLHPCVDCGESDVRVLEFDHLRDKIKGVAKLAAVPVSLDKLKEEIEKCEVRCANCHKIKTYERGGWTYALLA